MVFFNQVELAEPDKIFGIQAAFDADLRANKVNLSVGVFRDEEIATPILTCVKKAETELLNIETTKEYLPIDGDGLFLDRAAELVFGGPLWKDLEKVIYSAQGVGGTGALRIGGEFLKQEVGSDLFVSRPTWANHIGVFSRCGMRVGKYPYYNEEKKEVDFESLYKFLEKAPKKSIILLHASCHNPTGADLTLEQWDLLSNLFFEKELFPFFDNAYQGFGQGLELDAQAIRLFAAKGHEMLIATSFSKNFSLYAERIAALFIVAKSTLAKKHIQSKVKPIIRTLYSNPPMHGAHIISYILTSKHLRLEWEEELELMRKRINEMRQAFAKALALPFLLDRNGLFCYSGLSGKQVDRLVTEYGIYMTHDGRINVAGLNKNNIDYVVNAIASI